MKFNYFLFGKDFSSYTYYTYIRNKKIEDEGHSIIHGITEAARKVIAVHRERDLKSSLGIEIYLPNKPFQDTGDKESLTNRLEETVDDLYLMKSCRKILSDDDLLNASKDQKQSLIIVHTEVQFEFAIFTRVGERMQYVKSSNMRGAPGEIVKLVEEYARKTVRKTQDIKEGDISTLAVYETGEATTKAILNKIKHERDRWELSLIHLDDKEEGIPVIPVGRGCLFVEIVTLEYNYLLFKKQDTRYTYVTFGTVQALPPQSMEAIVGAARDNIKNLGYSDVGTASENLSVWEPRSKFSDVPLRRWEEVTLEAGDFPRDLLQWDHLRPSKQTPRTLVVVFTIATAKRTLETIYETEREAISKMARKRESPSSGSKHSAMRAIQHSSRKDAVYNNRPQHLTGPPIQIYHPAFTTFIREISRPADIGTLSHEELDAAAELISASLDFFAEESDRRTKLNNLKALGDLISPDIKLDARTITLDGTTAVYCPSAKQDAIVRIVELKNDVGEGASDPIMQAECGFVLICSSEMYKPFFQASCCPMFLIGVVGPQLAVSGAVFADNFVSQRLTDYVYLGPHPTYEEESALSHRIRRVAQILRALKNATEELKDYYRLLEFRTPQKSKLRSSQCGNSHTSSVPLHPISLKVVPPYFQGYAVDGKEYKIHYEGRLAREVSSKAVFKGTIECEGDSKTGHDVVIKFTYAYCKAAHERLAADSRAPDLLFCCRMENIGMYVVVMDYVDGEHVTETPLEDKKHVDQLRAAIQTLHDEDYVFGDLRGPNILIATDGLKLIDFDWCGKERAARYPADINLDPDIKWHSEVRREGLITKAHDIHMLNLLVGSP